MRSKAALLGRAGEILSEALLPCVTIAGNDLQASHVARARDLAEHGAVYEHGAV